MNEFYDHFHIKSEISGVLFCWVFLRSGVGMGVKGISDRMHANLKHDERLFLCKILRFLIQ